VASPSWKDGRYSRYVPAGLREAWRRAAADPELTSLRSELQLLTCRVVELLGRIEQAPPAWTALQTAWDQVMAAPDQEAQRAALVELAPNGFSACFCKGCGATLSPDPPPRVLSKARIWPKASRPIVHGTSQKNRLVLGALLEAGLAAAQRHEVTWREIRQVIQERTQTARAEARREVEARLMLSREQALNLTHRVFLELRSVVLDPDTFAKGPQAVLASLQRRLARIVGQPEAEGGEVLEGSVVASEDQRS
jgi:hypothetical protein